MVQKIIIITNGKLGNPDFFRKRLEAMGSVFKICCDGGIRHLEKLKISPDVIMGDMDSANDAALDKYRSQGVEILKYRPDKDVTDTQLAVEYALKLKSSTIEIWGGLGGRIDHALANLFVLNLSEKEKIKISLIDEYCEVFIIKNDTLFYDSIGQTVSIFALGSEVDSVTLCGFRYPLDGEIMEANSPRGISNVIVDSPATIHLSSGSLLVVRFWQKDFFPEAV